MKYKVLKETPWHNVGDIIDEDECYSVYESIYIDGKKYLISENKKKSFFQPIRFEKLPQDFIWDGVIYTKCMNGFYRSVLMNNYITHLCNETYTGTIDPDTLLVRVNNSTLPVYEIKRYEQ